MIRRLALFVPLLFASAALAEMPHMEEFSRKLSLSIGSQAQDYGFDLSGGKGLEYAPNVASLTVFTINYNGIGALSYGVRQTSADSTTDSKGHSDYQDFRFNFPYRRFNVFLFYSRFKGFYLSNSSAIDSTLPEAAPYIKFPDMYAQNMGANFTWVWNPERFSLAAIMDFTERQVKAGGSMLIGVAATETIFRNGGAIIPSQAKDEYGEDAEMYEGRVRALSAKIGYGYTDVYRRRWFTSILAGAGFGPQEVRISTPTEDYSILRFGFNLLEVYAVGGYNGDQFFSGLNVFTAVAQYQAQKAQISTRLVNGGLFIGTRF